MKILDIFKGTRKERHIRAVHAAAHRFKKLYFGRTHQNLVKQEEKIATLKDILTNDRIELTRLESLYHSDPDSNGQNQSRKLKKIEALKASIAKRKIKLQKMVQIYGVDKKHCHYLETIVENKIKYRPDPKLATLPIKAPVVPYAQRNHSKEKGFGMEL